VARTGRALGEAGGTAAPTPPRPLRYGPAANDNRAPLLRRLLLPLVGLAGLGTLAAALYTYLA
jgi:hypothetical protein